MRTFAPVPKRYVGHRTAERPDREHAEDVLSHQPFLDQRMKLEPVAVDGREPGDAREVTVDAAKFREPFRVAVEIDKMDMQNNSFRALRHGG